MSAPSVLSVGQCGFDHAAIARHLAGSFGAKVRGADTFDEALEALRRDHYDLVLVNRVNDTDGAPGLELIGSLKATPELADLPVMLVSDRAQAQEQAQALGALPGFGKSDLRSALTRSRLAAVLGTGADADRAPEGRSGR
jgi:two-component system chemotaxis response regulator CheY